MGEISFRTLVVEIMQASTKDGRQQPWKQTILQGKDCPTDEKVKTNTAVDVLTRYFPI